MVLAPIGVIPEHPAHNNEGGPEAREVLERRALYISYMMLT